MNSYIVGKPAGYYEAPMIYQARKLTDLVAAFPALKAAADMEAASTVDTSSKAGRKTNTGVGGSTTLTSTV